MKVIVLIPSQAARDSAGVRIRYSRVAEVGFKANLRLDIQEIDSFDPWKADYDTILISKCYDARSLIAAEIAVRRGRMVGVDLFDDYFSQLCDSRLCRFRTWLRQMVSAVHFVTCSTAAMASVATRYRPDLPVHIMADPAPAIDYGVLRASLTDKLHRAKAEQRLGICWYGVGDNPNFDVGLRDIFLFGGWLRKLLSGRVGVELTILTNGRALSPQGLRVITNLPIATSVCEWSQKRESELLKEAFAVFLPVSAKAFSVAKSLNRAVTALSSGCQVLSVGFPLYDVFEPVIYREPDELIRDFHEGRMRFSEAGLGTFQETIETRASATNEAASLVGFLEEVVARPTRKESHGPLIVLHGAQSSASVDAMTRRCGGLSVASPFSNAPFAFDAFLKAAKGGKEQGLFLFRSALRRLVPGSRRQTNALGRIGRRKLWRMGKQAKIAIDAAGTEPRLPLQLARYGPAMANSIEILKGSFGASRIIVSENSQMPFELLD